MEEFKQDLHAIENKQNELKLAVKLQSSSKPNFKYLREIIKLDPHHLYKNKDRLEYLMQVKSDFEIHSRLIEDSTEFKIDEWYEIRELSHDE